jgi:hypothetical protein
LTSSFKMDTLNLRAHVSAIVFAYVVVFELVHVRVHVCICVNVYV